MRLEIASLSELKALIVEDSIDDCQLLVDYLKAEGINIVYERVDTGENLVSALEKPWDIIFSDFSMPQMNGMQALALVRKSNKDIPFIYVSGTIGEVAAVQAIKSGAQDYVMKSDLTRLIPTIERELNEAENRRQRRRAEETLKKLSLAITQAADSVYITDADGRIEYANPAFESMTGYSLDEVKGKEPAMFRTEHYDPGIYEKLWEVIRSGQVFSGTLINKRKDGSEFHEEKVISPLFNEVGMITHFVSTGRDITQRVAAEKARERLMTVLNSTPDLVAIISETGELLYMNRAGYAFMAIDKKLDIIDKPYWEVLPEHLTYQFKGQIFPVAKESGQWFGEVWLSTESENSTGLPASMVVMFHVDSKQHTSYFSLIGRDISERKRFESKLQYQATHDGLTNLPNRYFLIDRLRTALHAMKRRKSKVVVFFIDIDNFKRINDTMGHAAGDNFLKKVAQRLRASLRPTDTIARLGGDEFTIVVEDIKQAENAVTVLNKIYQLFSSPIQVDGNEFFVSLSIGIAIAPQDGNNEIDLLRHADIAMYRAKAHGTNQYQFYETDMDARGHEILQMDTELRYAVKNREFAPYYQPQIDVKTGKIIGMELLLRWNSPKRGLVMPSDFIPLLETSGLIVEVGEWIIEQACRAYFQFKLNGFGAIKMGVNVSAVQLQDHGLLEKVENLVLKYAIPRGMLELELTENIVMQDPVHTAEILTALNRIGVRTAIDDFGTGYSSLAYLKKFTLSTLKIDKSFVDDVVKDKNDASLVEASISLGHKLGMTVVAEGVEQLDQLAFLREKECDVAQGYLFSKPIPEAEMINKFK